MVPDTGLPEMLVPGPTFTKGLKVNNLAWISTIAESDNNHQKSIKHSPNAAFSALRPLQHLFDVERKFLELLCLQLTWGNLRTPDALCNGASQPQSKVVTEITQKF